MKYTPLIIFFILFVGLTTSECKKHKTGNPVDQLPPETQIGANTFGCLIDGNAFLPKGPSLSPILQCAYQYLNTDYSKGFFFQLSASHKFSTNDLSGIGIYTDSLPIIEGTFNLGDDHKGGAYGLYLRYNGAGNINLYSKANLGGQLTITKFDEVTQIVSGRFWFNVVDSTTVDTIHITNGRFDMQFTK
ncbi:MAG: DUF6252 family protein [Ginsengibacter sp.]